MPHESADSHASDAARLRAVLEATVDAIISIDARGAIQMMNPAAERMFGYKAGEAIGQNVKLLMPSPYREEHDGYLARYLQTGEKRIIGIGREAVGQRKDGSTFPLELSVAESRIDGQPVFVGVIRDITERKRINEEVRAMTQQLWHAAKLASVGELAASIAHELNNPLATVCLRVESVLNRTPADDPRRKALEVISQETQRMADLVSNLLQFSRRGHGQVSTVDVRDELAKAIDLIQHHLQKHLIHVSRDFAPDTPTVHADRQKLRQVFLNLLTNASDAMPKGGRLVLRTQPAQMPDGERGLQIEISDSGVGIPSEDLDRVMEPFYTTKEEGKGTGLGLAICRRIVQEHQGQIRIESQPGNGATVRITIPVWIDTNVSQLRAGRDGSKE